MKKECYEKICAGEQVRTNLIALREELKDEKNRRVFAYLLGGNFEVLCRLLNDEDPKIRKNAALILGKMESEDLLPVLFDAYKKEKTMYIRADYLKAISGMDYSPLLEILENRLEQLRGIKAEDEAQKHISEEIRMLQTMVLKYRKVKPHRFTGSCEKTDMLLVTNRCHREITARQIPEGRITMLAGGIRVNGAEIGKILPIRTYSELLFPIETRPLYAEHPEKAGLDLAEQVLAKARKLHRGDHPFLFRIELKSRMNPEKKGAYIRKISDAVEKASAGALVNSVTDYELEIRLLERRDGTFAPMIKLYTVPNRRFAYRKEVVASSIAPVNAALAVELARPYLREGAQILDPFCGVGTMLIERERAVAAGTMYGIDIFGEAVEKARENTSRAGCRIYYINKDFFEFEHEYLFDEVITDMPQATASRTRQEIRRLYREFFGKIGMHLKRDAVMVLYATEPQYVIESVREQSEYQIAEKFTVNEKNGTGVFIIRRCGGKSRQEV